MVGMRPPRAAVATTCNRCHQPDGVAPEGDRPARARAFLDALQGVRANLDAATRLEAARPFTPAQQVRVETLRRQAEASLEQLEGRVHAFTGFDAGAAGVAGARTRVTALLDYVISAPLQ